MKNRYKPKLMKGLEHALTARTLDFSATYMTVSDLHAAVSADPDKTGPSTIQALKHILQSKAHTAQSRSLVLYQEAASCLGSISTGVGDKNQSGRAISTLKHFARTGSGNQHRAAAAALGSLPIHIDSPAVDIKPVSNVPAADWEKIRKICRSPLSSSPRQIGRSLVLDVENSNQILIIKMTGDQKGIQLLQNEASWMDHLNRKKYCFPEKMAIPRPMKVDGGFIFRPEFPPHFLPGNPGHHENTMGHSENMMGHHENTHAISFLAQADYFNYPNDHRRSRRLTPETFKTVISKSALMLGSLTAHGIVHTAPIPLFHNRAQRQRRSDQGRYEWARGGRLDRWLLSSRYPNFGLSGIRDLEHLTPLKNSDQTLYHHIGTHLLSLVLVAGSYFRHRDPESIGFDPSGQPVDVRHLFDPDLFKQLLMEIFLNYYKGFTGYGFEAPCPFDPGPLTARLVEEMGVDRHMEEIIRADDIKGPSGPAMMRFLSHRGFSDDEISRLKQQDEDIVVHTGPHLGAFNRRISVPELIIYLGTCAAICISDKFCAGNRISAGNR
jgi:hypothetical protein